MRKIMFALAIAAGHLASAVARAEDPLEGLEMDVIEPGETPTGGMFRIALPGASSPHSGKDGQGQSASAPGRERGNGNGNGNGLGNSFGQDTAEQARSQHGNSGRGGGKGPGNNNGQGPGGNNGQGPGNNNGQGPGNNNGQGPGSNNGQGSGSNNGNGNAKSQAPIGGNDKRGSRR